MRRAVERERPMCGRSRGAMIVVAVLLIFIVSLEIALPSAAAFPAVAASALHVHGHRILDADGREVVLHGVNRMGSEYMCVQGRGVFDGPTDQASIDAMKRWGIDSVRLPLNEDCWLGINGVLPEFGGPTYRDAVATYARALVANGLNVILDLHWSAPGDQLALAPAPMPDADHSLAFWSDVAATFKGNDAVIFEVFNEPHPDDNRDSPAAWTCWRDGAGACAGLGYEATGMTALVGAIRGAGATNVIALPGVQWANTLTHWLEYAPRDASLVAVWHTYNWAWCITDSCYAANVSLVNEYVPVLASEIGSSTCDSLWMNDLMGWLDHEKVGYLAWSWSTWLASLCESSALILDYDGTPSPYGLIYQTHLAALPRRILVR